MLDAEEALGISPDEISAEQGFLDENGDFITRAEVAQRSGMPPRTFATSEDLTPEGNVNPIPREPPNIVPLKPKVTPRGLGEAGKIGISRVFHGTRLKGFDKPTLGSSGVHVGTPSQAADFAMTKTGGRVIPLWAKVGKELPMRDLGAWSPTPLITEAERAGGLPSQVAEELRNLTKRLESNRTKLSPDAYWEQRQQLVQTILDKLKEQGYDAISYINRAEGDVPTESMIILDPEGNLVNALERPNPEEAFPEAKGMPVHELQDVEPDPNLVAETARLLHEEWSSFSNKAAPSVEEITSSLLGMGKSQSAEFAKPFFPEEEGVQPAPNLAPKEIIGKPLDADVVDNTSGEVLVPRGTIVTEEIYKQLNLMPGSWSLIGKGAMPMLGGMTIGSGGALALMLKLQQMRQKNK